MTTGKNYTYCSINTHVLLCMFNCFFIKEMTKTCLKINTAGRLIRNAEQNVEQDAKPNTVKIKSGERVE